MSYHQLCPAPGLRSESPVSDRSLVTQPPRELNANATDLVFLLSPVSTLNLLVHLMDGCPNEILGLIFQEACADGGRTGRSLSLVSRYIHDTSRRYAFQSIALYGSHQLFAFASLLDGANPEDRGIHHLYLTDRRRVWMEYLPGQDREQQLRERGVTEDFHVNDPLREYSFSAILRIFKASSSTLQTLVLLFDQYDKPLLSDAVSFPNLHELTIHTSNIAHNAQSEIPQCLSLRRLHVIQDAFLSLPIAKSVSRLAPLLTHLRISHLLPNAVVPPMIFALDIRCTILNPYDPTFTDLPPTLERILVQMAQRTFPSRHDPVLVRFLSLRSSQSVPVAWTRPQLICWFSRRSTSNRC